MSGHNNQASPVIGEKEILKETIGSMPRLRTKEGIAPEYCSGMMWEKTMIYLII